MPFDGAGTFNPPPPPVYPPIYDTIISEVYFQALMNDVFAGLTNVVTRDGQSPALADLPMGGFKHTGCADGTLPDEYATVGQLNAAATGVPQFTSALSIDATGLPNNSPLYCHGRTTAGDGGGGFFTYSAASVAVADDIYIFTPTTGPGRVFRVGYTVLGFNGVSDPRWAGADPSGVANSTANINAILANALTRTVNFYGGTWKCNGAISHPKSVTVDGNGALIDFSGSVAFAGWTVTAGVSTHQRTVLSNIRLKGVATPADGVFSATTVGLQTTTHQIDFFNVEVAGFLSGVFFNNNSYVITLYSCSLWYNGTGWEADQTAKVNMGASLKGVGCLFAHNDYDVYNVLCESSFVMTAFDNWQKGCVRENITSSGGANNSQVLFDANCRFEAGGDVAIPAFKNSGLMIFRDPMIFEPIVYSYFFDNSGFITITGGLTRLTGLAYTSRNTGSGRIVVQGLKPVDLNGEVMRFTAKNSGMYNNDLATGTTAGFTTTAGSGANTTFNADTPSGYPGSLQIVSGGVTHTIESEAIPLSNPVQQALLNLYFKNTNVTDVSATLKFYTAGGTLLATETEVAPASTAAWTRMRFIGAVPAGAAYCKFGCTLSAGQTAAVRFAAFYFNFS